MNEDKIEQLLRKAPQPAPPAGLQQRLQRAVRLPRPAQSLESPSWTRRWMPALSFAVFFVACMVAIGVQMSTISELKRQNEELRAAAQNIEQLRTDNADYKRLFAQSQELDRLQRDQAELDALRKEVGVLRAQIAEAAKLRSENSDLRASNAAASVASGTNDFFAQEQALAERKECTDHMKQIGLSIRTWALDNNDAFPPDFISMTNELNNWRTLQCPSDKSRNVSSWANVAAGNVSYQYLAMGLTEHDDPSIIACVCPIHHNYGLIDGSVQQLSPEAVQKLVKMVNGRLVLSR